MPREHYHFVTGELAAEKLREVVGAVAVQAAFDYTIDVLPIAVAAMITPKWAARRVRVPTETTRVLVPGWCHGDLKPLADVAGVPVERGPKDLRQLSEYFGHRAVQADYGDYDIEILAQIRDGQQLAFSDLLWKAKRFDNQGADVIVLVADPRQPWSDVGEVVRALREEGRRVAIDSRSPAEIADSVKAGAELVFSVNSNTAAQAVDWGTSVVVVPDAPGSLKGIEQSVALLAKAGVPFRLNPGLDPIAFGFAESLGRYLALRWQWPEVELMMNLGTIAETTEVDTAGSNALLMGFCQEMAIRSVLVSQDNSWSRSCVRECDLARQMVFYAHKHRLMARQLEPGLLMLRDTRPYDHGIEALLSLAKSLEDHSFRIFAENGRLHAVASELYLDATDPYDLFEKIQARSRRPIDNTYAFYLGYEMAKAVTALTLGKNYRQDEALDWGMLTVRELTRKERRALRMARQEAEKKGDPPCE